MSKTNSLLMKVASPCSASLPKVDGPGLEWNNATTRRRFLKRTGGATIATILVWNCSATLVEAAAGFAQSGGSDKLPDGDDGVMGLKGLVCAEPANVANLPNSWSYEEGFGPDTSYQFEVGIRDKTSKNWIDKWDCSWAVSAIFYSNHAAGTFGGKPRADPVRKTCLKLEYSITSTLSVNGPNGVSAPAPCTVDHRRYVYLYTKNVTVDGRQVLKIAHVKDTNDVLRQINGVPTNSVLTVTDAGAPSDPKTVSLTVGSDFGNVSGLSKADIQDMLDALLADPANVVKYANAEVNMAQWQNSPNGADVTSNIEFVIVSGDVKTGEDCEI